MGQPEDRFIECFYQRYSGRVAIGVAYSQDMLEVFPIVIEDAQGNILGIVAMAAMTNDAISSVHIFHISVFRPRRGNGTRMLEIICCAADQFKVVRQNRFIFKDPDVVFSENLHGPIPVGVTVMISADEKGFSFQTR